MKHLLVVVFLLLCNISYSQNKKLKTKFRDVSIQELKMDSCDFYPDADAMVLFNKGEIRFSSVSTLGIFFKLEVHKRIKIFTKDGKNLASDKIHYYKSNVKRYSDEIRSFKAYTYNLEGGKIVETKLKKEDKFENDVSDYRMELSFTMPNIQEGSVIDIKYTIVSHNLSSLRTWYFQDVIPVKYNQLIYETPEIFDYQTKTLGNVNELDIEKKTKSINLFKRPSNATETKITAINISPLEHEPYLRGFYGLLSRVEFDLVQVDQSYTYAIDLGSSYQKFNENLMESHYFGSRLSKGRFSKKWKPDLDNKTSLEKSEFILKQIQNDMAWNKIHSISSEYAGGRAYGKKEGSIADINLTLISALRYHDIEAYPVILMTERFGILHPIYPRKRKFNYIVALVKIDGKEYLCDATLDAPFGQIRQNCINGKGWLVDTKGRWIDLTKNAFHNESAMYNVEIKDNFIYNNISVQLKDYAAYKAFISFKKDIFKKSIKEKFDDWIIENIEYDKDNDGKVFKYKVSLKREIENDNLILIDPFIIDILKSNPFVNKERSSNMDFIYKKSQNYIFNLQIPEGYTIEVPKNTQMKTEDKSISYFYMATQAGQRMSVINKFNSKRSVFSPAEYNILKVFYENMVSSNKQIIVLKKNK